MTSVTRGGIMTIASATNGAAGARAITATAQAMRSKTPMLANSIKMSQNSLRLKPSMFKPAPLPKP